MALQSTATSTPLVSPVDNPSDRRVHPRFPSSRLGVTRVRIPSRSGAALVDLSSGGALLELPFQMRPDSRFGLQLDAADSKLEVPVQILRCYVAELKDGVVYHAAGAFDDLLDVKALAQRASSAVQQLLGSLETLERGVAKCATRTSGDILFHEILADVISWLRRNESLDLVVLKVKARLTQTHPSLAILPFQSRSFKARTSLECFGLTFQSKHPLSANDRRFFKANGQLISMLEDTRRELRANESADAPLVIHNTSDWFAAGATPQQEVSSIRRPRIAVRGTPKPPPLKTPEDASESLRTLEALIFNPAMA